MLTRYTVLENFNLDGDVFLKGSTFLHEDEIIGELLRNAGFVAVKPTIFTIKVENDPYQHRAYLSQMNKTEAMQVAENEEIKIDPSWNKAKIIAEIKRIRALRGDRKK